MSLEKDIQTLQIVAKPIDDLIPYVNNPRQNDAAVDRVAASIHEFGFKVPIIISADNVIIAGHTRLKAALKLGLKEVPCIIASDLTEGQIKAFRLADNKVAEYSSWDMEALQAELQQLSEFNFDMTGFGFMDINEPPSEQSINPSKEINTESFGDDQFDCECPRCGFRFNKE